MRRKVSVTGISVIIFLCVVLSASAEDYKPYLHNANVPEHPDFMLFGSYKTSIFPGAATYSIPLTVPPGTHGMQPVLEISYNSQNTHQGILGIGWTLTQSYVLRVGNGTNTTPDDTYRLVFDSGTYSLIYGTDGQWHTDVEQHFKIENLSGAHSYWKITRADGMRYRFGFTDDAELQSQYTNKTVRWSLDKITDTFGNAVNYSYRENPFPHDNSSVYLDEINYGTRKITFVYENATRPDRSLTIVEGNVVEEARRLTDVYTFADNSLVRRYALRYDQLTPVASSLGSVVEYGTDNSSTFTLLFDYFTATQGYGKNSSWEPPIYFSESVTGADYGVRLIDFNNDGFVDIIKGRQSTGEKLAWRNDRQSGWVQDSQWNPPIYVVTTAGADRGVNFADVNNDGYTDILEAYDGVRHVYLNNKSGWNDSKWVLPSDFIATRDRAVRVGDINGDNYPDLVRSDGHDGTKKVYINNRSGWTDKSSDWVVPEYFTGGDGVDLGGRLIDINGDGMFDIIKGWTTSQPPERSAWISTGSQWINMSSRWKPPLDFKIATGDAGVRLYDANGDGLVDIVHNSGSNYSAWLNNGTGWLRNDTWASPLAFTDSGLNVGVRIADVDGDGFADIISARESAGEKYTYTKANQSMPLLLRRITNEYGGVTNITYVKSTTFNNSEFGNSTLGFNIYVVSNVTTNGSVVGSLSYNYSFGKFDNERGEFRGFGLVHERMPSGATKHYFYQDIALHGKEYLTEIFGDKLLKAEARGFNVSVLAGVFNATMTFVSQYVYDVNETAKVTNTTFSYDNYGNVVTVVEHGDLNVTDDYRTTVNVYAVNRDNWILDRIARTRVYDSDDEKVRETTYAYDDARFGEVASKGALTKKEEWNNVGNNTFTYFEYDDFGNVVKVTDTLGQSSSVFYDGTHTFPVTNVNAMGHVSTVTYDTGTGNVLTTTSNDVTTTFVYDVFGRIVKEVMPLDTVWQPTKSYNYSFDGVAPEQVVVQLKTTANNTDTIRYYYDGFGQLVQLKKDIENNQQVVQNFVYDSQGRVVSVLNPYFTSHSHALTAVTANTATNYSYDALDRVTSVRNADGTFKNVTFDRRNITDVNENGVKHVYQLDGFDRIIRVYEFNNDTITGDNETYTTSYSYDGNDNLVGIIDTEGNEFGFTYDSLGRKIGMDDPDLGHWVYRYDGNGNLVLQNDSRNQVIRLAYDGLNRVTKKTSANSNITYNYDQQYLGTLSSIVRTDNVTNITVTNNYEYDDRLRITKQIRSFDNLQFPIMFGYDSQDRLLTEVSPMFDIDYIYNSQGKVRQIPNYLTESHYNAFGSVLNKTYGNGLIANFTYHNQNIRLSRIFIPNIQDLSYTYDNVGNIKLIDDAVTNIDHVLSYDALDRLTDAQVGPDRYAYSYNPIGNMMKIVKNNNESKKFTYNGNAHFPSQIIDDYAGVDVYRVQQNETNNKTRRITFYLVNDKNESLSGVNWTVQFGDGSSSSNTGITIADRSVFIEADHVYSNAGSYAVNVSARSPDITDSEVFNVDFGIEAQSLSRIYNRTSNQTFEFIARNELNVQVQNLTWRCLGIQANAPVNLTANKSLFVYVQYNASAGNLAANCSISSLDGSAGMIDTFNVPGLSVENYSVVHNASRRVVSYLVRNEYVNTSANIKGATDAETFTTIQQISPDSSVNVTSEAVYSSDGNDAFVVNASSGSASTEYVELFSVEGSTLLNYTRANYGTIREFVFYVKNNWVSGLNTWTLNNPSFTNSTTLNFNDSLRTSTAQNYSTQGIKKVNITAQRDTFIDKIVDRFENLPIVITSLSILGQSQQRIVQEAFVHNNLNTTQTVSWIFRSGEANITSIYGMNITGNAFVFIEANYSSSGVYQTDFVVNSSLFKDNQTGVVVS